MFKCLHFADPSDQNVSQLMLKNVKKRKTWSYFNKCSLNVFANPSDQNVCLLWIITDPNFFVSVSLKWQRCSRLRESQVTECSSDGVPTVPYHAYSMTKGTNQLTIGPLSDGLRKRQKNHTNTDTCQPPKDYICRLFAPFKASDTDTNLVLLRSTHEQIVCSPQCWPVWMGSAHNAQRKNHQNVLCVFYRRGEGPFVRSRYYLFAFELKFNGLITEFFLQRNAIIPLKPFEKAKTQSNEIDISPSLLLALVLVELQNTCKKKLNGKMLERPNTCYIFEKLRVQGCQIWHSHVSIPFNSAAAHSTRPHNAKRSSLRHHFRRNSWKLGSQNLQVHAHFWCTCKFSFSPVFFTPMGIFGQKYPAMPHL